MSAVSDLRPKQIWSNFAALNAIPRASKKEERVRKFIIDFAKTHTLDYEVDTIGNIVVRKPATPGFENRKNIVLQSHLDMVHQKNNDTTFDFDVQGIEMYVDGDWVKAKGTTLGADNGIGVAAILGILQSKDIEHPALEALFTIDEETGMTGAKELKSNWLHGDILLNLDTEQDNEIDIGCAGGIDISVRGDYQPVTPIGKAFVVTVKGLQGGHSGMDIHKGLANANVLMNRILYSLLDAQVQIATIQGGSLRNAIPRESVAIIYIPEDNINEFNRSFKVVRQDVLNEFKSLEPNMVISFASTATGHTVMQKKDQLALLHSIYSAHHGVYRMSPDMDDLVECSNNIAKVALEQGEIKIECLTRSSVQSSKMDLANKLKAAFSLAGYQVIFGGDYPGWQPNPSSEILQVLSSTYSDLFGHQAAVVACHAGLECGIIGSHYPKMDMISFGPTIKGAHSPDERVSISSVQKFWKFLKEILKRIP